MVAETLADTVIERATKEMLPACLDCVMFTLDDEPKPQPDSHPSATS
jgi:hypothetical protein